MNKRNSRYFEYRKHKRKSIQRFQSLTLQLATPASFPDCGFFYAKIERERDSLSKYIHALPHRKWLVLHYQLTYAVQTCLIQYYGMTEFGYSAAEMDEMMIYGNPNVNPLNN